LMKNAGKSGANHPAPFVGPAIGASKI